MKKAGLVIFVLVILLTVVYAFLGGFKSVEKSVEQQRLVHIAGTFYEGKIGSDTLQNLFMLSRKIVEKEEAADAIAIVYFGEANEETGAVSNFIGVLVNEAPIHDMPEGWEIKTFERNQTVMGCIEANVLAMPTPNDMLVDLKDFAKEKSVSADTLFIEYYHGPNQLCVELLGVN